MQPNANLVWQNFILQKVVLHRAGQFGEMGSLRREGREEGCGYSEVPRL
jgi:hypothetical protein